MNRVNRISPGITWKSIAITIVFIPCNFYWIIVLVKWELWNML